MIYVVLHHRIGDLEIGGRGGTTIDDFITAQVTQKYFMGAYPVFADFITAQVTQKLQVHHQGHRFFFITAQVTQKTKTL